MASLTRGTTFVDGVANDVTAAKLHALVDAATPTSGLIQDRTAETAIAVNDNLLIGDASDSNNLKRMTVANFRSAATFGTTTSTAATITSGTITTLNSTTGTITTGVIPTLTSITKITSGTGTAAAPAISPTGDTNTGIFFPAADTIAFSEGGAEVMRIDSSGNVGIGTASPVGRLHVSGGNIVLDGVESSPLAIQSGDSSVGLIEIYGGATNKGGTIQFRGGGNSGDLRFLTGTTGTGTERLRIDSSGNVGIGTTSVTSGYTLDTRGWIRSQHPSGNAVVAAVAGNTTGVSALYFGDSADDNPGSIEYNHTSNSVYLTTNGTERLRIDSSGNVGIGTASPVGRLHVSGGNIVLDGVESSPLAIQSGDSSVGLIEIYGGATNKGGTIQFRGGGNSGDLRFLTGTTGTGTERLRIDSSGNVGIGTASPDALLHVFSNQNGTAAAPQFRITGAVSQYEALHYIDATAYYIAQDSASRELRVYSGTNAALGVKLTAGATSWASISDSRSKDIIEPITNSLDKIQNINPVIGKYKNDELNTRRSFVIGQDVQEVFPESISVDSEGYISVRYSDLIPLLIGGIKELKSENDSLKSRIESLEAK